VSDSNGAKLLNWTFGITNVAVLIGLVLVIVELDQNTTLTRVNLVNESATAENETWITLMGEAPGNIIAMSIECPTELTFADYVVLDSYMYTALNNIYRKYELAKEGLFTASDWQAEVRNYVHWYLDYEFGRVYWERVGRPYFDGEFSDYVDLQLTQPGINPHDAWLLIYEGMNPDSNDQPKTSNTCEKGS